MIVPVTSADDPRLRPYRAVGDPDLARREGLFVAEGREVVRRLLSSPTRFRLRSLLVSAAARTALVTELDAVAPEVPVFEVPAGVTESLTGFHIHRGCLALVERPSPREWQQVAREAAQGPLIVLEDVGNPDNVGGVFRNTRAFGAGGVLLNGACSDPLYRKAIRTSMGAVLDVPFAAMRSWPDALGELRGLGWRIVGLVPGAHARLSDCLSRFDRATPVALLAGHEGHGLTEGARAAAHELASIPMARGADSLNVSVAVAIALYELRRAGSATEIAISHCAGT